MVTQWFIDNFTAMVTWFIGVVPDVRPPDYWTNTSSGVGTFIASAAGLGAWVPYTVIFTTLGVVLTIYGVMFGVKAIRAVISYLPFFGGAG